MLLRDRNSIRWAGTAAVLLVVATTAFVPYILSVPPRGASGGSVVGIVYGSIAAAMLLLALLLGARKKLRTWRIGRAYTWMQMHVWFGLLCYPIAYFHIGGLHWGGVGSLTWAVMLLLTIVWLSGLVGLVMQQFLPKLIFHRVAREVTYEQHGHVLKLMRAEALATIEGANDEPDGERINVDEVPAGSMMATIASATRPTLSAAKRFEAFYVRNVAPFLEDRPPASISIRSRNTGEILFRDLRRELPATMQNAVTDIETLVEERRQMLAQATMHRALHGWLFVHVPLSYGLAVLVALHAVFALRYVR